MSYVNREIKAPLIECVTALRKTGVEIPIGMSVVVRLALFVKGVEDTLEGKEECPWEKMGATHEDHKRSIWFEGQRVAREW